MEIVRRDGIGEGRAVLNDRIRRLHEEKGRVALVVAQFARMRRVVAADAVDAAHREPLVAAGNRKTGGFPGGNCVTGQRSSPHGCSVARLPATDRYPITGRSASSTAGCAGYRRAMAAMPRAGPPAPDRLWSRGRSEEHTSELQSLMRI